MSTIPLAVDLGNRFVKASDGISSEPWSVASIFADLIGNQVATLNPATSVEISYFEGNSDLVGKRWIVGESARDLKRYTNTVQLQSKAEVALKLFLSVIRPASGSDRYQLLVDPLHISLPDPDQDGQRVVDSLKGNHEFRRNGTWITLSIGQVKVHPEGVGGYHYAIRQGALQRGVMNGVLDLGGGTAIGTLFNAQGQEIPQARAVFRKGGSYSLASEIAADRDMKTIARGAAKIDLILDAIADGSCIYGATGQSFKHLFDAYHQPWLSTLISDLMARWDSWLDSVSKIVIVGGGAPLAQNVVNHPQNIWFVACPNPQFANVLGLKELNQSAILIGA